MAIHSSILVWKLVWTEEPGGLQSMELQIVGHDTHTTHQVCITSGIKASMLAKSPRMPVKSMVLIPVKYPMALP